MKEQTRLVHEQHVRVIARISFMVAVLLIVGVSIYLYVARRTTRPPVKTIVTSQLPPVVSAENFQSFIGPVTNIASDAIAVRLIIIRPGGTSLQRDYEVRIGDQTVLSTYTNQVSGPEYRPATLADFRTGDHVAVYGQEDLSRVISFTALKIYKII